MIARAERLVVLVSGGIPGERVRARIERVGKGLAFATAVEIEEPSSDRRGPSGDPLCGGCLYAHIAYPRQLELKSLVIADAFARIGRLELPGAVDVAPSPEDGYRMRARLHLRGRRFGFFREGTHDVCDARQTRQLLPATFETLDRVMAAVHSVGLDGITEIELAENLDASHRVMHLDSASGLDARSLKLVAATDGLTGLSTTSSVYGDVRVTDAIALDGHAPLLLRRHVLAFFQGNRYLLNQLVSRVLGQVEPGSNVIDLYAGVGLFAVAAALTRGAQVTAVEGDRHAAADLAVNAVATNGGVVAVHQSVEEFVDRSVRSVHPSAGRGSRELLEGQLQMGRRAPDIHQPDGDLPGPTLIVDPPRTGMSREALDGICRMRAARIVFVSCDVATLARDARRIVDHGYAISKVEALDLFPNTPHVETVTVFQRT